jgi:hypothetical protein
MYISIGLALDFGFLNAALMSDLLMFTKCNDLADKNLISVIIPTYSISNSFPFPTFAIISLDSGTVDPPVFAKIRRSGRFRAAISGRLDKKHEQIWSKPGSIWSYVSASHDLETPAGRYVSRAGKA